MRTCLLALALSLFSSHSWADWRGALPDAQLCGQGEFRKYGFDIYEAQLWGACASAPLDAAFALQLTYHRTISRRKIVESSLDEMKRLAVSPVSEATLEHWRTLLEQAFVDVKPGDSLTGVYMPGSGVRFFMGAQLTADIKDAEFARMFFRIWLDPDTQAPELRKNLLRTQP
ncbi:chalcone isomerase family protein [Alcaligenaceae bacterium]|nr:chalcone isomerase family protein [Alcaligenaceae bacterium]